MSKEKTRFRSITDLLNYKDPEPKGFREPSLTDPSDHEPIDRLVGRMVRGEIRPQRPSPDAFDGVMDTDADVEAAIERMPVYERSGFDLSDVARVREEGEVAMREVAKIREDRARAKREPRPEPKAGGLGKPPLVENPAAPAPQMADVGAAKTQEDGIQQ